MSFFNVFVLSCWSLVVILLVTKEFPVSSAEKLSNSINDSSEDPDVQFITLERADCTEDYDCGSDYNDGKRCYEKKCIDCHLEYTTSKVCTDGSKIDSILFIVAMVGTLLAIVGGIGGIIACCWFCKGCPMHMAHHNRKEMDKLMNVAIRNAAIHKSGGSRNQSGAGTAKNSTGGGGPGAGASAGAGSGSGSPSQVAPAPF